MLHTHDMLDFPHTLVEPIRAVVDGQWQCGVASVPGSSGLVASLSKPLCLSTPCTLHVVYGQSNKVPIIGCSEHGQNHFFQFSWEIVQKKQQRSNVVNSYCSTERRGFAVKENGGSGAINQLLRSASGASKQSKTSGPSFPPPSIRFRTAAA